MKSGHGKIVNDFDIFRSANHSNTEQSDILHYFCSCEDGAIILYAIPKQFPLKNNVFLL